jgi:AcrR family transcriptional regulator
MSAKAPSRPYRKKKRARQEQETRRRITEAAVELHRTEGPARAAITDIAKRAGVSRMTVYSHFPSETDLFMACSTHWATRNPFPDPTTWAGIEDPLARLGTALAEMYRWYDDKQDMMGKVFRDLRAVESLAEVMNELWSPYVQQIVDTLAAGWSQERSHRDELSAALNLVLDFQTWQSLTESGLTNDAAADLATRMVGAAMSERRG